MSFEYLDRSIDADSDSEDEALHPAHSRKRKYLSRAAVIKMH